VRFEEMQLRLEGLVEEMKQSGVYISFFEGIPSPMTNRTVHTISINVSMYGKFGVFSEEVLIADSVKNSKGDYSAKSVAQLKNKMSKKSFWTPVLEKIENLHQKESARRLADLIETAERHEEVRLPQPNEVLLDVTAQVIVYPDLVPILQSIPPRYIGHVMNEMMFQIAWKWRQLKEQGLDDEHAARLLSSEVNSALKNIEEARNTR
jgi:hypothetical protein